MNGGFNKYEPNKLPNYKNGNDTERNPIGNVDANLGQRKNEFSPQSGTNSAVTSKKKTTREKIKGTEEIRTSLFTSLTAIIVALMVGVVPISELLNPTEKVVCYLYPSPTGVRYEVMLEERKEESDLDRILTILVQNDFTSRTQEVEGRYAQGSFYDLTENMDYTFKVMDGNKTLYSKTFRTELTPDFSLQEFEAGDTYVNGYMAITDYAIKKELSLSVTGGGNKQTKRVIVESEDADYPQDVADDETTYVWGWLQDGVINFSFWFEELSPLTDYSLTLADDGRTLFTYKFKTTETEQPTTADGQG